MSPRTKVTGMWLGGSSTSQLQHTANSSLLLTRRSGQGLTSQQNRSKGADWRFRFRPAPASAPIKTIRAATRTQPVQYSQGRPLGAEALCLRPSNNKCRRRGAMPRASAMNSQCVRL